MMNKVNRFLLVYIIVITALCGYMCYTAFYKQDKEKVIHQHNGEDEDTAHALQALSLAFAHICALLSEKTIRKYP